MLPDFKINYKGRVIKKPCYSCKVYELTKGGEKWFKNRPAHTCSLNLWPGKHHSTKGKGRPCFVCLAYYVAQAGLELMIFLL
jgi:hypothetical protein